MASRTADMEQIVPGRMLITQPCPFCGGVKTVCIGDNVQEIGPDAPCCTVWSNAQGARAQTFCRDCHGAWWETAPYKCKGCGHEGKVIARQEACVECRLLAGDDDFLVVDNKGHATIICLTRNTELMDCASLVRDQLESELHSGRVVRMVGRQFGEELLFKIHEVKTHRAMQR